MSSLVKAAQEAAAQKGAMPGKAKGKASEASVPGKAGSGQIQGKLPAIPSAEASRMMNVLKHLATKMDQPQALLDYQADKRKFYWDVFIG